MKINAQEIISQVFKLYCTRSHTEQAQIVKEYYSPLIRFEDPLMITHAAKNYQTQFHSLVKLFSVVTVDYDTVQQQSDTELVVKNKQHYEFHRESWLTKTLLPATVDLQVTTTITLDAQQKVIAHRDVWDGHREFSLHRKYLKPATGYLLSQFMQLVLGW